MRHSRTRGLRLEGLSKPIAALTLAFCVVLSSLARAQDTTEHTAAARSLFEQGMDAVDRGAFEEAADLLERSMALRDSPVVRINLALAYVEQGRLVEASEQLRAAARAAPDTPLAARAQEELAVIEPRFAHLRVRLEGTPENAVVELDGHAVPPPLIGVPQPVDPGEHELRIRAGEEETTQAVTLAPGEERDVTLALTAARPSPTHAPSSSSSAPWALIVAGAGVAVVGGVLLGYALAERAALEDIPRGSVWMEEQGRHDAVPVLSGVGITALVLGGAALAAGLVWVAVSGSDDADTVAFGIGPGQLQLRGTL